MRGAACSKRLFLFIRLFMLACAGLPGLSRPAIAQSPATLKAFAGEPHLGKIEDALVGLETTITSVEGVKRVQRGNGLLLRSDGFVLAPSALFRERGSNVIATFRSTVAVTLRPGSPQERRVKGTIPRFLASKDLERRRYYLGYVVFKVQDIHVPAARALLPDTLTPGQKTQVAWSNWNETRGRFEPVQKRSVAIGAFLTNKVDLMLGRMALADALPGLPLGAVVLAPEDVSVGMITQQASEGKADIFDTLALLNLATNCVTPLSVPASRQVEGEGADAPPIAQTSPAAPADTSPMLPIPGGPVQLPPKILAMQPDMEGARTACVAPFEIDKYQVTNAQYLEFWKSLTDKQRADAQWRAILYPVGWGAENAPFPAGLATTPVLGVRMEAAQAYAKWKGKRLPTSYEWCLAAFGPTGGNVMPQWARQYAADRQKAWQKAQQAHLTYLQNTPILRLLFDPQTRDHTQQQLQTIPWFLTPPALRQAVQWSRSTCEEAADEVRAKWGDTLHVLPNGSRPYDVSPYGVSDMIMNAWEPLLENPMYQYAGAGTAPFGSFHPPGSAYPYLHVVWINPGVMPQFERRIDRVPGIEMIRGEAERADTFLKAAPPLNTRRLLSSAHYMQTHEPPEGTNAIWFAPLGMGPIYQASCNILEVGEQLRCVTQWKIDTMLGPTLTETYRFDDMPFVRATMRINVNMSPAGQPRLAPQSQILLAEAPATAIWGPTVHGSLVDMGASRDDFEPAFNENYTGERAGGPAVYLAPCGFRCAR